MIEIAKNIKMVLTDVDGVLTDASMNFFTTSQGELLEVKKFHAFDGMAFHMLRDFGIKTGIITGGNAPATEFRAKSLGMDFLYYSFLDKFPALEDISKKTGIPFEQIAYIGDDLIDIPVLRAVGLPCAVRNARPETRQAAILSLESGAGCGAFRELTEIILKAQGHWPATLKNAEEGKIGQSPKGQTISVNGKEW